MSRHGRRQVRNSLLHARRSSVRSRASPSKEKVTGSNPAAGNMIILKTRSKENGTEEIYETKCTCS